MGDQRGYIDVEPPSVLMAAEGQRNLANSNPDTSLLWGYTQRAATPIVRCLLISKRNSDNETTG